MTATKFITKLLSMSLLFTTHIAFSQNVPLGVEQNEQRSAFESTDAVLDEMYYYRNMTFEMKAGEGVFFYMIANEFSPRLYTIDTTLTQWAFGTTEDYIDGAEIAMIFIKARIDTVFNIVYSGTKPFYTGPFIYGIRKLSAQQMQFNSDMPFCDRFTYIVNNWQCYLGHIPKTEMYAGIASTSNSILPGGEGFVSDQYTYQETFYKGSHEESLAFYNDITEKVKACLDLNFWEVTSMDVVNPESGNTTRQTWYNLKGAYNGQHLFSFNISYDENGVYGNEVFIKFY